MMFNIARRTFLKQYEFVQLTTKRSIAIGLDEENLKDFNKHFQESHVPTTPVQHFMLRIGSGIMAFMDPGRADMVAVMGETTGLSAMKFMLNQMQNDPEGARILKDKPRIHSSTVDLEKLAELPEGTLGRYYLDFLDVNKVTPDSRDMVKYVDDVELAYVIQRYREIHDIVHTILLMPTNMLGEVTVKWVEGFQTKLPLCTLGGLFGAARLAPKQRRNYVNHYLPWAIKIGKTSKPFMCVYYEERWDQPMESLWKELNIEPLVIPKSK